MTLTQLEYVVAVDRYRHFSKAAKACFVTQPTLSMQLQKLEEELDVIIFDRSKNPIVPTIEGEAIINQAKVVLREQAKIGSIAKMGKESLLGDFKLGVIPTLSPYVLPLFVNNFANHYPKVNLVIEEYKTEDIIRLLEGDELDGGLLATPLGSDLIIERALFYEPFYLFVNPNHSILGKEKIHQDDLSLSEIWLLNKGNCFREQILNICTESDVRDAAADNLRFESGNLETLKNMVLASSGYTLVPHLAMKGLDERHMELIREFMEPIPTREISLVYSRIFQKERIIDALENEIVRVIPKELKCLKRDGLEVIDIYPQR